ncbi:hypothetical protein SESBI_11770 [Sesbania bispinosa]|nr:hypothetical protein SESBI_11770 [Sesbania bispinosa]
MAPSKKNKYHAEIKQRTIIPDRNLLLKEAEYPEIQATIAKLRWEFFCQIAGQGRQGLTFEFYANGWRKKDEDWPEFTTFVRGKMVKFDSAHINKILCIGDDPSIYGPTFVDFFRRRPDFQEILQVLCCSDAVWLPINQPKHKALKMGVLQPFPRAWGAFIIAFVLPVLHDTTLLLDRGKLLFAIIKGMKIDLGSIISKEMENIMSSKTKSLAYPSLITLLCLDAQILENQTTLTQAIAALAKENAALARRQDVLYRSLKRASRPFGDNDNEDDGPSSS